MKKSIARLLVGLGTFMLAGLVFEGLGWQRATALFMPSAQAVIGMPATPVSYAGVARRTARRTVAVESGAAVATAAVVTTAAVATTAAVVASRPVVVGTVVAGLPGGCAQVVMGGMATFNCGGVYYRPTYQGPNLVYVVVSP